MFYSHEILTSRQYGVATVWLVATIGATSTTRKINRKAIQDVDLPKACGTILQPPGGAPIALRLQGNLLFGVTAVYSKQSGYLLNDAEKIQMDLRTFRGRRAGGDWLDVNAGKAKRHQIMLPDDPAFVPSVNLPAFDLDFDGQLIPDVTQWTMQMSSHLSSIGTHSRSPGKSILMDIRDSSSSHGNYAFNSPFGLDLDAQKPRDDVHRLLPVPGEQEDELAFGEFGLVIDAEGNIIDDIQDQPRTPENAKTALEHRTGGQVGPPLGQQIEDDQGIHLGDEDARPNFGRLPLPDAPALPTRRKRNEDSESEDELSSETITLPQRKRRIMKKLLPQDGNTRISHHEFRSWQDNYSAMVQTKRVAMDQLLKPGQAKANAFQAVYGFGIRNIGRWSGFAGFVHPLAGGFAGQELEMRLLGVENTSKELIERSRRRSSSDAFSDDEDGKLRRVRARHDDNVAQEHGRDARDILADEDELGMTFDDDIEVGRAPGSALSDQARSAPWNRPGSLVPSSVNSYKSAQAALLNSGRPVPESPLVRRRNDGLPDFERYSDAIVGSEDFLHSFGADQHQSSEIPGQGAHASVDNGQASHAAQSALDSEGQHFRNYVARIAEAKGRLDPENHQRHGVAWVDFEDLLEAQDRTRVVASQAFYQVLSLLTKGELRVEQAGIKAKVPFGEIRIGVEVRA